MSTATGFATVTSIDSLRPMPTRAAGTRSPGVRSDSSAAPVPRLRITARGRAVVMVLVALPIVGAAVAFGINGGVAIATGAASSAPLETVTIMAGQSLWDVAEHLAPQADPREFISDVISFNTLVSAEVRPGQQLEIPAEYSH